MQALFELILMLAEVVVYWRFWVPLFIAGTPALALHLKYPHLKWLWFVSIPLLLGGLAAGIYWQFASDRKRK